jgi:endo-1,4-beta-xylanase
MKTCTVTQAVALLLICFSGLPARSQTVCSQTELWKRADFPVGVAVNTSKLRNEEKYWKAAVTHFNSFTPEKILKPQYLHPEKDRFDFFECDRLMDFCEARKIRLHGHTLVWHKALPGWMEGFKGSAQEWEMMLREHVQTIVKHCSGKIKSWDVVNEAFNEDGTLRKNIWLTNVGEQYVEKAFQFAREADSTVLFFYNDYSLEKNGQKLRAVLAFLDALRAKGIRVDGIGLQMHVTLQQPRIEEINEAAKIISEHGYLVHYSELDVALNAGESPFSSRKKKYTKQEQRMKEIVAGYTKLKPEMRFGITLWGVSDNDSWLSDESERARPLLLDRDYEMKPAFCGFLEGLGTR